jgi:hypothetical protein
MVEILVGCEHRQLIPNAKLRQQRIYGPRLNTFTTTPVSQSSGMNVIVSVRDQ